MKRMLNWLELIRENITSNSEDVPADDDGSSTIDNANSSWTQKMNLMHNDCTCTDIENVIMDNIDL